MALFDKFKKKDKEALDDYPTMTPGMDTAGLGPAGTPATSSTPAGIGLPALPTATTPPATASPQMEILKNKIDMLISKIDALKSALDMLNQKISQMEQSTQQPQQQQEQGVDIYGSQTNPEKKDTDYNPGGWQF